MGMNMMKTGMRSGKAAFAAAMLAMLALTVGAGGRREVVQKGLDVLCPGEGWRATDLCEGADEVGVSVVLVTHPRSEKEPSAFTRRLKVERKTQILHVRVSSCQRGKNVYDWVFAAKVNGETVRREVVCSAKPVDIKVPLGRWAGKEIELALETAAGGKEDYCYEYANWHQIAIVDEYHPDWVRDLVIYEIATKSFNSPNGPEQGTFRSVREKLPYLQELGINAIWLTGSDLGDPHHFYNIWTQYASYRPDRLDPSLGTHADLRELTAEAHRRGIRIFLDVITHGVMDGSDLVKEHPNWFKGGSWGMTDYNWSAHLPELDAWWVKTFTDYCLKDGIDGFRLDCGIQGRQDLWREIKRNVWAAGREIAVLTEGSQHTEGVADSCQSWRYISCVNGRRVKQIGGGDHVWNPGRYYGEGFFADYCRWNERRPKTWTSDWMVPTIEISCHDNGWSGFPPNQNPYVTNGSRALMGASALLAPAAPIMMMGEEFDADYVPVPGHCGELFGKDRKTPGRWLYGSWLQWSQLEQPRHRAMLADVRKMLALRRRYAELVRAQIERVPGTGVVPAVVEKLPANVHVPYLLFNGRRMLLVAGNATDRDVTLEFGMPWKTVGWQPKEMKSVWHESAAPLVPDGKGRVRVTIPRDYAPGGGLAVFAAER